MESSVYQLGNLIEGFRLSCHTENKSPKTIEWYTAFLTRFLSFLKRNNLPTQLDKLQKAHIRHFILYLQEEAKTPHTNKALSGATVQGYVRTLKAFFAWAEREEYLPASLMTKISIPKAESKVINTFSDGQIQQLFSLCLSANGHSSRNSLILLLLLDCGLRVSELVGIEIEDINLEEGLIRVRKGKGSRERQVPVGSMAVSYTHLRAHET